MSSDIGIPRARAFGGKSIALVSSLLLIAPLAGCSADEQAFCDDFQQSTETMVALIQGGDLDTPEGRRALGDGMSELIDRMRSLTPPSEVEGALEDITDSMEAFADGARDLDGSGLHDAQTTILIAGNDIGHFCDER